MAKYQQALTLVLKNEGGFVSNPYDHDGGATNMGITLNFYRKKINPNADIDDIRRLNVLEVEKIYKNFFWDRAPYEEIISQRVANKLFDLSVNVGQTRAIAMLQKAYNSLNSHNHVLTDGALGPQTLNAINSCDQERLYNALICEASKYYYSIAKKGNNIKFLNGWLNRLMTYSV